MKIIVDKGPQCPSESPTWAGRSMKQIWRLTVMRTKSEAFERRESYSIS